MACGIMSGRSMCFPSDFLFPATLLSLHLEPSTLQFVTVELAEGFQVIGLAFCKRRYERIRE